MIANIPIIKNEFMSIKGIKINENYLVCINNMSRVYVQIDGFYSPPPCDDDDNIYVSYHIIVDGEYYDTFGALVKYTEVLDHQHEQTFDELYKCIEFHGFKHLM